MDSSNKASSSSKKEEKKREWTDKNEQVKFVCQGAKVQCKYCNPPIANLIVTTESVKLQDKLWATVGDKDGKKNFGFTGVCMHPSQQKPMSPPPPCNCVIRLGEWIDYSETIVGNSNTLLVKSKIPCMISGENLEIVHSGQTATLTEINPIDFAKKILDVYWIDEVTNKKMREVQEGRKVTLYVITRGYKEGEQVTVKVLASEGHAFKNGSTEMLISAIVNSENFATKEDFSITYK